MIFDDAKGIDLIHHIFLHDELIDDLILDAWLGHHIVDVEMKIQGTFLIHIAHDTSGIDYQLTVIGLDMSATEVHAAGITVERASYIKGYREPSQYGGKGLRDIL